jgi:flagellar basal body L-ring protein FlgH
MDMHDALVAREERSGIRCRVARNAKDIKLRPISARRSSEKTDIRRNSLIALLLLTSIVIANGESLWSPGFDGYLSDGAIVVVGDVVTVEIDSEFVFSYSASSNDSKGITLEYSGGEFGDLLSFLPAVKTGSNRTTKGEDTYSLSTDIVARVVELDANGGALIEGSRILNFEGKQESMTLSGWVAQQDLGRDRRVSFSKIADSRIVFRGLLQPSEDILTAQDIEEVVPEPAPEVAAEEGIPPEGVETAAETITGVAAQPVSQALPQQKTYRLSDEKKRELFLRYVNRLIDLIFR